MKWVVMPVCLLHLYLTGSAQLLAKEMCISFDLISVKSMCHYDTITDFYQLDTVRSSSSQECKQSSIKRGKTEQNKNLVLDRNFDPLFQGSINPDTQTTLT